MALVYPTGISSWDDPSEMFQIEAGPGAFLFHVALKKKKKKLKDNCFTVFVKNLQFYNTVNIVKYVSAIHQHESAIGIHMSASSGTVLPPPTAPNNSRFLSFLVVIG